MLENITNLRGTVTDFFSLRGYGYLNDDKKGEYCFYTEDIQNSNRILRKGESVDFDVYVGHGVRAVNLRSAG